jgi:hypothetical protein
MQFGSLFLEGWSSIRTEDAVSIVLMVLNSDEFGTGWVFEAGQGQSTPR